METALTVTGLVGATLVSFSIAFLLEWLFLCGLMRLMPTRTIRPMKSTASGGGVRGLLRMPNPALKG